MDELKEKLKDMDTDELGEFIGSALCYLYGKLRDVHGFYYEAKIMGDVDTESAHLMIIQNNSRNTGTYYDETYYLSGWRG